MDAVRLLLFGVLLLVTVVSLIQYGLRRSGSRHALSELRGRRPIRPLRVDERKLVETTFVRKILKGLGESVHELNGSYARHGIQGGYGSSEWHDLIDGVEVKLHAGLRVALHEYNRAQVVLTRRRAVVLELNGITLAQAVEESRRHEAARNRLKSSAAHRKTSTTSLAQHGEIAQPSTATTEPLGSRVESREQARLRVDSESRGSGGAVLFITGAFGVLFGCLLESWVWGAIGALVCLLGVWRYFAAPKWPMGTKQSHVHSLRGTLHQHVKVKTVDASHVPVIATYLGDLQVSYPGPAWMDLLAPRLPATGIEIEVDTQAHVVRHERVSLYELRRRFPVVHWIRHVTLAVGVGIVFLISWYLAAPLSSTVPGALHMLQHRTHIQVDTPQALMKARPRMGDTVTLSGQARCSARPGLEYFDLHPSKPGAMVDCTDLAWNQRSISVPKIELPPGVVRIQKHGNALKSRDMASSTQALSARERVLVRMLGMRVLSDFSQFKQDVNGLCNVRGSFGCMPLKRAVSVLDRARHRRSDGSGAVILSQGDAKTLERLITRAMSAVYSKIVGKQLRAIDKQQPARVRLDLDTKLSRGLSQDSYLAEAFQHDPGLWLQLVIGRASKHAFKVSAAVYAARYHDGMLRLSLVPRDQAPSLLSKAVLPLLTVFLGLLMLWQMVQAWRTYRLHKARKIAVEQWLSERLR